jgi:hypothetical protein
MYEMLFGLDLFARIPLFAMASESCYKASDKQYSGDIKYHRCAWLIPGVVGRD